MNISPMRYISPAMVILMLSILFASLGANNLSYAADDFCLPSNARKNTFIPVKLAYVIDGDSIKLKNGAELRIIGINAPEYGEYLSGKAKSTLKQQINTGKLYLQQGTDKGDSYGRILAHLWVKNAKQSKEWLNPGVELLKQGLAFHVAIYPNFANIDCYWAAEQHARTNRRGIWTDLVPVRANSILNTGFAVIQGKLTQIIDKGSAGSELVLANNKLGLWIPAKSYKLFGGKQAIQKLVGQKVIAQGWIYKRRGNQRLQMNISHPYMLKYD